MDFSFLQDNWSYFLVGATNTLIIAILVVIFSFILGFFVALLRLSRNIILKSISSIYVEVIRGTPMLLQILIAFVIIRVEAPTIEIGIYQLNISVLIPGLIALVLNSGAYLSETIRAGLQSVPLGQIEAAKCIGLPSSFVMLKIRIPQAIRTILPPIGNELVTIIKDSSLLSTIGVFELMHDTRQVQASTFIPLEPLFVCALLYFIMTFATSRIVRAIEHKLKV